MEGKGATAHRIEFVDGQFTFSVRDLSPSSHIDPVG
jgi:hypothetical protein